MRETAPELAATSARLVSAQKVPFIRRLGATLPRGNLFWMLQIGGWAAFGLMMFGYALAKEKLAPAIFDVIELVLTGLALTSLYRYVYRRWRAQGVSPLALGMRIVLLGAVGVPLWWEPQALLSRAVAIPYPSLVAWVPSYTEIPLDTWIFWGPVLLSWSFLYFGINDWMSLQLERRRTAAAEAMAQAARFRALQSQLQPHFLFNTLNSIASLVLDGRGDTAVSMISRIGDFIRLSLQTSDTPQIPLQREITFVRHYLEIEQMRFGDRLRTRFDIDPGALGALVPTLLLQPLVENAVRHGILPRVQGGSICISARAEGSTLKLRVEDDGAGFGASLNGSPGIGLSNTARRLDELFGGESKMVIGRGANCGVAIDIDLPLQLEKSATAFNSVGEAAGGYPHAAG